MQRHDPPDVLPDDEIAERKALLIMPAMASTVGNNTPFVRHWADHYGLPKTMNFPNQRRES